MLFPATRHSLLPSSTHLSMNSSSFNPHPSDQWAPTSDPTFTRVASADPPSPRSRSAGGALRLPSLSSLQLPGLIRQHPSPSATPRSAPVHDRATSATNVASPPRKVSSHRTTVSGHRVPSRSFSIRENYPPSAEHVSAERDPKVSREWGCIVVASPARSDAFAVPCRSGSVTVAEPPHLGTVREGRTLCATL